MLHNDRPEDAAKQTGDDGSPIGFADNAIRLKQGCRRVLVHHCFVTALVDFDSSFNSM